MCVYVCDSTLQHYYLIVKLIAQSAGAVEYTNGFSTEGLDTPQRVSWNDTKQSDGEVPVLLELWEMQSTPSLPLLPGPL